MPVYPVKCPEHGTVDIFCPKVQEFEEGYCPICNRPCSRDWNQPAGLPPFKSYWTEAFASKNGLPVEIRSREEEAKRCRDLGWARIS